MNDMLTPAESGVLSHLLVAGGAVDDDKLPAAELATLTARGYVRRMAGFAIISAEGRGALKKTPAPSLPSRPAPPLFAERAAEPEPPARTVGVRRPAAPAPVEDETGEPKLNPLQEDLLRRLVQESGGVPVDDVDGRVVRALHGRGLVATAQGKLEVTDAGRDFYEKKVRRRRRARSGWLRTGEPVVAHAPAADGAVPAAPLPGDRRGRADSLRRAVIALEQAIDANAEIGVGDENAPARDVFAGMLELADRIERGDDPRRISRGPQA
ncbi:MAG TPA: hypothetical protein VFE05_19705 [Longimicrobiaceae bacterium]|nr:hypothetical protein [Longimicrobiaceae bacterium]